MKIECLFDLDDLTFNGYGNYTSVSLVGGVLPEDSPGTPWLPAKYIYVLIPSGTRVESVETSYTDTLVRKDIEVYPVQPPVPLSENRPSFTHKKTDAYAISTKVPVAIAEVTGHHVMRGHNYVSIRLNPVRYKAAAKELYLTDQLLLTLHLKSQNIQLILPRKNNELFTKMVKGLVVNGNVVDSEREIATANNIEQPTSVVDYLIITSSELANSFQSLADHRSAVNGWVTEVVTVESIYQNYSGSDNQEKIRNCIKDYIDNHSTLYVVLGGDDTIVPDRDCYVAVGGAYIEEQMPTDLYYAGLDSSWDEDGDGVYGEADTSAGDEGDLAPDVIIGRIPVRIISQASAYINKLISFENSPPPAPFQEKLLICGDKLWDDYTDSNRPSDLMSDGYSDFQNHSPVSDAEMWLRRLYRDGIQPYWNSVDNLAYFFDTLTSWDSSVSGDYIQSSANVTSRFNEGWHHIFFGTHGNITIWGLESGYFSTSSAASLNGTPAIIYTMTCLTGHFDGSTEPCLSEAFIRNAQGGAIAYFGCSRYGWGSLDGPPASNLSTGGTSINYAYEFYEQLLSSDEPVLGKVFSQHKAALAGLCGSNGSYRWVQFGLNYQGDPAIGALPPLPPSPPQAFDDNVIVQSLTAHTIELQVSDEGQPDPPGMLTYIITSLPANGSLTDPGGGAIGSVPYTIVGNGNHVVYEPNSGYLDSDSFNFKANDGGRAPDGGDSNTATISISIISSIYFEYMDTDPNWSTTGQWQFGVPTGQGGGSFGNPDPTNGNTGSQVYGVNLNGDYSTAVGGPYYLTTQAINCSGFENIHLNFYRWLNTDYQTYAYATIEVSNDGLVWFPIWDNGSSIISDSSWTEYEYDISSTADRQSTVYLRWGYQIASYAFAYSGWNIDDVEITGNSVIICEGANLNDIDGVDLADFAIIASQWMQTGPGLSADIAGADDTVNITDLRIIAKYWLDPACD